MKDHLVANVASPERTVEIGSVDLLACAASVVRHRLLRPIDLPQKDLLYFAMCRSSQTFTPIPTIARRMARREALLFQSPARQLATTG
jgi:hypothetical protein